MGNLNKRLPVHQLRPGMYVEDVFNESGLLLYSADTLIKGYHQIESLKKQGVSTVFVNVQKSSEIVGQLKDELDEILEGNKKDNCQVLVESLDTSSEDVLSKYEEKLKQAFNVRQKTVSAVRNMFSDIKSGRLSNVQSMVRTVEDLVEQMLEEPDVYLRICQLKKHSYNTFIHSVNVSILMTGFASAIGYSKDKILDVSIGGILHDVGKIKIPEHVLRKDGAYTFRELEMIQKHPLIGIEIIKGMSNKIPLSSFRIVSQHHERTNGSGYPQRLKGTQIDDMAMICAITDVYDLLTSENSFRKQCLPQEALALIFQGSEEEYPRTLVENFTKMLGIYPVGSFVKLSSGEMGVVVKVNRNSLLTPHIMILFDEKSERISVPYIRDLSAFDFRKESTKIECSLNPEQFHVDMDKYIAKTS